MSSTSPSRPARAVTSTRETGSNQQPVVLEQPDRTDHRRGIDRGAPGLVVEGDVTARDRGAERGTGIRDATNGLGERPHDLGSFRVSEVQTVGDGQGAGP